MKAIPLIFSLLCISLLINAEENSDYVPPNKNTLYVEILGQGLFNSISFDRLYHVDKKIKTSFTAGLTIFPTKLNFAVGVPVSYNFLFGQKSHHLELGAGLTAMYSKQTSPWLGGIAFTDKDYFSYFTPKIGYRYQKAQGGFFFRITFTPAIAFINLHETSGLIDGKPISVDDGIPHYQYFKYIPFTESSIAALWGVSFGYTFK